MHTKKIGNAYNCQHFKAINHYSTNYGILIFKKLDKFPIFKILYMANEFTRYREMCLREVCNIAFI